MAKDQNLTDLVVSNSELCAFLGVTSQVLAKMVTTGIIPKASLGRFNLKDCVGTYTRYLTQRIDEANRSNGSGDMAKDRITKVKAEMAEMELGLRTGKLMHVDKIEKVFEDKFIRFAARLQGIPATLAPQLAGEEAETIYERLEETITTALQELSTDGLRSETVRDQSRRGRPTGKIASIVSTSTQVDRVAMG